jgi:hypothetical protein
MGMALPKEAMERRIWPCDVFPGVGTAYGVRRMAYFYTYWFLFKPGFQHGNYVVLLRQFVSFDLYVRRTPYSAQHPTCPVTRSYKWDFRNAIIVHLVHLVLQLSGSTRSGQTQKAIVPYVVRETLYQTSAGSDYKYMHDRGRHSYPDFSFDAPTVPRAPDAQTVRVICFAWLISWPCPGLVLALSWPCLGPRLSPCLF